MKQYAKQYHLIMIASGEKDIITDGMTVYICENGDAKMAKITGSGCMSFGYALGLFWEQSLRCRVQRPVVHLLELQENLQRKKQMHVEVEP